MDADGRKPSILDDPEADADDPIERATAVQGDDDDDEVPEGLEGDDEPEPVDELINRDATPGAGTLPSSDDDGEVDSPTG
jgi:hypothetical protein